MVFAGIKLITSFEKAHFEFLENHKISEIKRTILTKVTAGTFVCVERKRVYMYRARLCAKRTCSVGDVRLVYVTVSYYRDLHQQVKRTDSSYTYIYAQLTLLEIGVLVQRLISQLLV